MKGPEIISRKISKFRYIFITFFNSSSAIGILADIRIGEEKFLWAIELVISNERHQKLGRFEGVF